MLRSARTGFVVASGCLLLLSSSAGADGEKALSPEAQAFESALKKALPAKALKSDGDAAGKLGTRRMRRANSVAAAILERRMKRKRAGELKLIREAGQAEVIVVRGSYDRVQDVLRAVKIKHVLVPPRLVAKLPLMSTQTLMINCPGRLSGAAIKKVRRFVKTGGYLVTTDWALSMLARAFPGYVKRGGRNSGNDVVKVHVHENDDPWLKQIKAMKGKPRWWLESSSYPIRVLNKQKVKVLISSNEMKRKYGHGAIAVAFRHDDGKVLHMTSHFYLQQGKTRTRRERAKGTTFARSAGMNKAELKALRKKGLDDVRSGDLNSAYSMQQLTTNVLVGRKGYNKRLLKKYSRRAKRSVKLRRRPSAKPARSDASTGKGYRLRVMQKKGKKYKVRDLFGNEGWVDQAELE
jgi:Bacterial SH3 domain